MEVDVVSKADNQKHAVATLDLPRDESHALAASSVRVWSLLIALASNNLVMPVAGMSCICGIYTPSQQRSPRHTTTINPGASFPHGDFGIVTKSSTEIPRGITWGLWPTTNIPVSLQLQLSKLKGHWTEISESSQRPMTVYNACSEESQIDFPGSVPATIIASFVDEDTLDRLAWIALFRPLWQKYLSRHTSTSSPASASRRPVHPLGMDRP
ncbi:hypothetical protein BDV12DRAFT_163108 [Aspergillus spectabilis]